MSSLSEPGQRRIKGLLVSRLLVIISIIAIPIFIFLLFSGSTLSLFKMEWIPLEWREEILMITPWVFTFGWLFMLILFANRISGSVDDLDENFQVIPGRYRLFYGINALSLMVIFAFPISTPLVAVLAFASAGYRLATLRTDWNKVEKTPVGAIVLAIIFAAIPAIISVAVLPDLLTFSQFIWNEFWVLLIDPLYTISLAMSTALTFGSLIILFQIGVSEYENAGVLSEEQDEHRIQIMFFEALLFAFLIFMEWKNLEFKNLFYYTGFVVVVFITIINWIKGRNAPADFKRYTFGYLLTIVLYGANAIAWLYPPVKTITVMVSAAAYIVLFCIIFATYDEE